MAAQQEALQGEVLSELLITDNEEVKAHYGEPDDTGIRKGAIIHQGARRGVVVHDPQDEKVAVRFPGNEEAEVLPLQEMREKEPDPSSYVPDGYAPKLQHKAELAREAQRRSEMVTPRRAEGEVVPPESEAAPMDVG